MAKVKRSTGGEPFKVSTFRLQEEPEGDLDGFMDSSTDSFLLFDEKLNCAGINPAGQELLNVSEETVVGKNIVKVIPGAGDPAVYEEYLNVMNNNERLVTNARSGERVLGIKAFKVGDGLGIIASDITERRMSEDALQESERHWQGMFNAMEDAALMIDRDFNIENINEAGLALLGESQEGVVGEKCYRLMCGMESPDESCPLGRALETRSPQSAHRQLLGRRYAMRAAPIFDENGDVIKFVETMRDVSESGPPAGSGTADSGAPLSVDDAALADIEGNLLDDLGSDPEADPKKARQEASERSRIKREAMLRNSALELSLSGVALADHDGNLTYVNGSFLRMWGHQDAAEILGRPFTSLWHSDERASGIVAAVSSLGGWEGELVALRRDGSTFEAELSACMVVDEESGDLSMVASIVDVTARKRAEEELARHQERLEEREVEHANELKYVDERLQQEAGERSQAQKELNDLRSHVEEMVEQRTAELAKVNEKLEAELAESKSARDKLNKRCSDLKKALDKRAAELKKAREQLEQERKSAESATRGAGREQPAGEAASENEPATGEPAEEANELTRLKQELKAKGQVIALSNNAVAEATADGDLTYVNNAFLRMWGFDEDGEILGRPFAGLWQSNEEASEVVAAIRSLGGWEGVLVASGKDDSTFEASLSACMVVDEESGDVRMVAFISDITERRQFQEKLKEYAGKYDVLHSRLLEWAERLNSVLKDLQGPAGDMAEAADTEDGPEPQGEADTAVEDETAGGTQPEDEMTSEAGDSEAVDAIDLEEPGAEANESAADEAPAPVEDQAPTAADVQPISEAETEEDETAVSEESGKAASMNTGLVDILVEEDS
jgi:PAS domain S-box-containing protein